jgi:hypothetical protein
LYAIRKVLSVEENQAVTDVAVDEPNATTQLSSVRSDTQEPKNINVGCTFPLPLLKSEKGENVDTASLTGEKKGRPLPSSES